jgi:tetratricopeptide (TPR) repeat protein
MDSSNVAALQKKASALASINKYEEALVIINKALGITEEEGDIWGTKGRILRGLGDRTGYQKCNKMAEKILKEEELSYLEMETASFDDDNFY